MKRSAQELKMKEQEQMDKWLRDLIEIIHFTERVAAKVHGLLDEAEIYKTVMKEFAGSKRHNVTIFLLTDDRSKLTIAETSITPRILRAAEKATGLRLKEFRADLSELRVLNQVVRGGETVQVRISDIIDDLLPRPPAHLVTKLMRGFEKRLSILTPLRRQGEIIGALSVSSTELADHFIPSVRNLARHISTALELAEEHAERKRMEEKSRTVQERFSGIYNSSKDAIGFASLEGVLLDVNDSFCELTGYSREELLAGKKYQDITPEEYHEYEAKIIDRILRTGEPAEYEKEYMRKDGSRVPILLTTFVVKGADGRPIGLAAIIKDITERKRAEEELAHERDLLHVLMDNIPDSIYFKDIASRFTRINRAKAQKMRIEDPEEAVGKTDFDFYPAEFAREAHADERRIVETGEPLICKVERIKGANGQVRWVSATKVPIMDKDGQVKGIVGISRDITERKKVEEALRESEEKLRGIFSSMTDGLTIVGLDGKILDCNEAVLHLHNISRDEYIGTNVYDFIAPKDRQRALQEASVVLEKGSLRSEVKALRKNGGTFDAEINVSLLKDASGEPMAFLGVTRDITERKRMEEELRCYSERLEELVEERTQKLREAERMAAIGETAAMVGHDLRNPLQAIISTVYLAKKKLESMPSGLTEKQDLEELHGMIEEQVGYMNKIVSDLQDYAGPIEPELVSTSPHQLIDDALSTIAVPGNVKVSVAIEEGLKLMVDPVLVRRVFTNLIANALQAMPDGGRLTISARSTDEAAFISVRDTGVGIPEEYLPKLFQPLFTTKSRGAGLGLAVCGRLVEAHGGSITVESEVGRGSTFTVKIPLRKEAS